MIPTQNWPKQWLLEIYAKAVEHGYLFIEPITEADAHSLGQRLYRIRRRADTIMAPFLIPEYQLVTVGQWVPVGGTGEHGRLPIIYNSLPDDQKLPNITAVDSETFSQVIRHDAQPLVSVEPKPTFTAISPEDLQLEPEDISNYVADMRRRAEGIDE